MLIALVFVTHKYPILDRNQFLTVSKHLMTIMTSAVYAKMEDSYSVATLVLIRIIYTV